MKLGLANRRLMNLFGACVCGALMAYALYAQYALNLDPCPLCIFQRVAVILLGLLFLFAAWHNKAGRFWSLALGLIAGLGAGVAAWHVHLQNLPPDEVPSCGPGLGYILESIPLKDMLGVVFKGSGQCAEISWRFLSLTMPTWVLIALLVLGLFGVWNNLRKQ